MIAQEPQSTKTTGRPCKMVTLRGQTMTIAQAAALLGFKASTLHGRLARKQDLEAPPRYGPVPKKKKRPPAREQGPRVPIEKARADFVASVVEEFGRPGNPTTLELALLAAWDAGFACAARGRQ